MKNIELQNLNKFLEELNQFKKDNNIEIFEENKIHKQYIESVNNLNNSLLYEIFASNIGLDFYWDAYGNDFINNENNKNKSLKELRILADIKRKENISKYNNLNFIISNFHNNISDFSSYVKEKESESFYELSQSFKEGKVENANLIYNQKINFLHKKLESLYNQTSGKIVYIENIITSFSNGNTNLQANIEISFEEDLIPNIIKDGYQTHAFEVYETFNKIIDIYDNSIYQLFIDSEKSNNIMYLDISINMKKNIKKSKIFNLSLKDMIDLKINKIYFVYPNETKILQL